MKLSLRSDFVELWYDHHFDRAAPGVDTYYRLSSGGPSRRQMFRVMSTMGLAVIPHGSVLQLSLLPPLLRPDRVVVYDDLGAHRGEGKRLMTIEQALNECPSSLASVYMSHGFVPTTNRLLVIGGRAFWLRYHSDDPWRSNVGTEVGVQVLAEVPLPAGRMGMADPLWAIDFVTDSRDRLWAIDLNIAPGLTGTGIEDRMKPSEVVAEIKSILFASCEPSRITDGR